MRTQLNYYQLLGIAPEASSDEVHGAYRKKSKIFHPDTTQLPQEIAIQHFQLLNEAYNTLRNSSLRENYDHWLRRSTTKDYCTHYAQQFDSRPATVRVDVQERPLSAGELFALLILGLTFLGCLVLALVLGIARGEMILHESPLAVDFLTFN